MSLAVATRAQTNLMETYLALARAIPHSIVTTNPRFVAASNPSVHHPASNFAAVTVADRDLVQEICALQGVGAPALSFYALDVATADIIGEAGYGESHRLVQMECAPTDRAEAGKVPEIALRAADSPGQRAAVSRFMIDQFFPRQTQPFRLILAQATAESEGLRLLALLQAGQPIAGLMLHVTEGMTGLYNVCVRNDHRHRGIGRQLVQWALAEATSPVVLQCGPMLAGWYESMGFRQSGTIVAMTRRG